jgi:putative DNA primase/helicase
MSDANRLDAIMDNAPADVPVFSEEGLGRAFATEQFGKLSFDHTQQVWFVFDGSRWSPDKTALAFDRAREFVRRACLSTLPTKRERAAMGRLSFVNSTLAFARSDQRLAIDQSMWDPDPWLLGVPGGVVDLLTGKMREAQPAERISRQCAVAPSSDPPLIWRACLDDATRGEKQTQAFLQRLAGYFLTGDVSEEILVFLYGPGGNGKGVFVSTVTGILADYAVAAPMEAFTAEARMPQEYYRAQMAGARLVTASETEAGRTWAESQIKELTGNEAPVSARHPYGRPFSYRPQFKLMFVGNHAPRLKGKSQAMERRLRIVPFEHEPTNPDPTLKERLRSEWPAILGWMIEGCREWQAQRLGTSKAFAAKTRDYFEQQDLFGRWLDERCIVDPTLQSRPGELYKDFRDWCVGSGEHVSSNAEFAEAVARTPNLMRAKTQGLFWIKGVGLKATGEGLRCAE